MANGKPWTKEEQRQAEELRASGMSCRAIGRELGWAAETVRTRLDPAAFEKAREDRRKYREANREQLRERQHRYAKSDPEATKERRRRTYLACYEAERERQRLYYQANMQRMRQRNRNWTEANREKCREYGRTRFARKRAANRGALVPLDRQHLLNRFALFGNRCAYCGSGDRLTVDHVIPLKAGGLDEASNIAPACVRCNCSKNAAPVETWYRRQEFFTEARWAQLQRRCPGGVTGQLSLSLALL